MKKLLALPPLLFCLCSCVDVPVGGEPAPEVRAPVESPFKGLDPGYKTIESAHFSLSAYSQSAAALYSSMCEADYTRIMQDLGLYSFVPARPYNVVIYRDSAEYHAKTGQPSWSGGAAYGNALLLYEGNGLKATMAHEMTHLVFNEFMGLSQAASLRWLNEGVAVYEEGRCDPESAAYYAGRVADTVSRNPIPFSQMVNLAPQDESQRNVDRWYAQVGSVVGFMVRQGGSFNFSLFLARLKDGVSPDKAVEMVYGGVWKSMADVERMWLAEVGR